MSTTKRFGRHKRKISAAQYATVLSIQFDMRYLNFVFSIASEIELDSILA